MKIINNIEYLIGIDEAGRGALAGPVAVGLVMWKIKNWPKIKKFLKDYPIGKDSKKLTPKQREFWFGKIKALEKQKLLKTPVALIGNNLIDQKGINFAVSKGITQCLTKITKDYRTLQGQSLVLLDGGLRAPTNWLNQQTIVKGDEKELIISLASIIAKVSRDRKMVRLAKKYPQHHLQAHKGYGTRLHYQKIKKFGVLVIHRQTYLPN